MVVDENYLNNALFNMFYNKKSYSVTETLLENMPEEFPATVPLVRALMNTSVWKIFFPDLVHVFGENQQMDFRCAFNKDYLEEGKLSNTGLSQLHFRDGDIIEGELNFGCSVYVYQSGNTVADPMKQVMQLFESLSTDISDPAWTTYRSFFASVQAEAELDLSPSARHLKIPALDEILGDFANIIPYEELSPYQNFPAVVGKLKKFTPKVKELRVFEDGRELRNEADELNEKITNIRSQQEKENKEWKLISDFLFG